MGILCSPNNSFWFGLALLIAIVTLIVDREITVLASEECVDGWDYDARSENCLLSVYLGPYLEKFLRGDGTSAGSKCVAYMKLNDTKNVRFNCSSKHQLVCQRLRVGARVLRIKLEPGNYSIRVSNKDCSMNNSCWLYTVNVADNVLIEMSLGSDNLTSDPSELWFPTKVSTSQRRGSTPAVESSQSSSHKLVYANGTHPFPTAGVFEITKTNERSVRLESMHPPYCALDDVDFVCRVKYYNTNTWEAIPVSCDVGVDTDEQCYVLRNIEQNSFIKVAASTNRVSGSINGRINGEKIRRIEDATKFVFEPAD